MALKPFFFLFKIKKSTCPNSDAFTRFSGTIFSKVIAALTPDQRKVVDDHGFGSLLQFTKCYIPNKFAQWVAHNVDYKSGDVVLDGKIISLTKESVQYVLGLPYGGMAFPADNSVGKTVVLQMFHKESIPFVTFFANKITKEETLSDQELFICFMLVALNSFLCRNSSLIPSVKHFGIFSDICNAKLKLQKE